MNTILSWIVGIILALLSSVIAVFKHKATKAEDRALTAESELRREKTHTAVLTKSNRIKDDLAKEKTKLDEKKEEVIQSVSIVEEVELSEDIQKLAAEQFIRASHRAGGV